MKNCRECCIEKDVACPIEDCRYWIDYEGDMNCSLIAVEKNGSMTLREVADRLNISFVRVKQIQDASLKKFMTLINEEKVF